jgi:hypothetical protein
MFLTSIESKEDHDSIKAAMDIIPAVGIYMWVIADKKKQGKKKQLKARTIFDYQGVSCVCALNFFRDTGQHIQVLWLATTLEAPPPVASIYSIWQRHQLATYLLCILIKQHTGIGAGTLDHSTLSLQGEPCPYRLLPKKQIPLAISMCHLASFLMIQMITDFQWPVRSFKKK